MPAIVGAVLAAMAIIIGVVALASGGGEQRTVTTVVLGTSSTPASTAGGITAPPAPPSGFPLGAVLPAAVGGWEVVGTDPAVAGIELDAFGAVETAQASRAGDVGLLIGAMSDDEDGRVAVERLRSGIGGTPEGTVPLGGLASEGVVQRSGGASVLSFAGADRVVIVIADDRDSAAALGAAASAALRP